MVVLWRHHASAFRDIMDGSLSDWSLVTPVSLLFIAVQQAAR